MTEYEIVKETIEYYTADPSRRASVNGSCNYLTPDNRMCAVGRCMAAPTLDLVGGCNHIENRAHEILALEPLLKEEYKGHSIKMWGDLQQWHDGDHWTEEERIWGDEDNPGLTEYGKEVTESILNRYRDK